MLNIQPNSKIMDNFLNGINDEIEKFVEVKTKEIIKNTETSKNKYDEYEKLIKLSNSEKMIRVTKISKIIDFFEEIFLIDEDYPSEKKQMFYFLNKLDDKKLNKLSNQISVFEQKTDGLRDIVNSIEKLTDYKGDYREEHSLYEIEGDIREYIKDTLLPNEYGFKGIREDF